jgi:hypothetical protein
MAIEDVAVVRIAGSTLAFYVTVFASRNSYTPLSRKLRASRIEP